MRISAHQWFALCALCLCGSLLLLSGCSKRGEDQTIVGQGVARIVAPSETVVAHTGSMRPLLQGGEVLHVDPIDIEAVREGDIIVTYWPGIQANVLHRVVAIRNVGGTIGLVTKGDANLERDPHITTAAELVGIVRFPLVARK